MYIIIVGGGKVGYYLAKSLVASEHEVLVIEKDPRKCNEIAADLGSGVVLNGDGCVPDTLEEAGTARADVIVAVTGRDEDNLVACQIAKRRFQVPRAVARINNPKNERILKTLGIDATVSATDVILHEIEQQLPSSALVSLLSLRSVNVEFVEFDMPEGAPGLRKPIKDLALPRDSNLSLVLRNGEAIVPFGATVLQAGDQVIAVTTTKSLERLREVLLG